MSSAQEHEFTCQACLCCVRCSMSMHQLHQFYRPCGGGVPHRHPGMERPPGEPFEPYVPDWATPLAALR